MGVRSKCRAQASCIVQGCNARGAGRQARLDKAPNGLLVPHSLQRLGVQLTRCARLSDIRELHHELSRGLHMSRLQRTDRPLEVNWGG